MADLRYFSEWKYLRLSEEKKHDILKKEKEKRPLLPGPAHKKGEREVMKMKSGKTPKLLLFDLDGTLLRDDKTISGRTGKALRACREKGLLIGVSTSRGEANCMTFLEEVQPDLVISSGGALVRYAGKDIYREDFSEGETRRMIEAARSVCGEDCEITADTPEGHFWNYSLDPLQWDPSWGGSIYTDFQDFSHRCLKLCVQIFHPEQAGRLKEMLPDSDCVRFSDGEWYKFTRRTATKERAILAFCDFSGISAEEIAAFGDDYVDIGMLKLCGLGIAMGNAIEEVKEAADLVIGSNEEDGIAHFLEEGILNKS